MRTIVSIGGGEIGRPGTKREVVSIDRHIIRLCGKKSPRLLFLPTASGDSSGYIAVVEKYFGKYFGCRVDTLCLSTKPTHRSISAKTGKADIIYVGGGDTKKMLKLWRKSGLVPLLRDAWKRGVVLCGVSAGAICWFSFAHSDSLKAKTGEYCRVRGLGLIKGIACPHCIREPDRLPSFRRMLRKYGGIGYAIDDCSAFVFRSDQVYTIKSKPHAQARVIRFGTQAGSRIVEAPMDHSSSASPSGC